MPEEKKTATYKTNEEPQVGDHVLGSIDGAATAGLVVAVNAKTGVIIIGRSGSAQYHERSGQWLQGQRETVEAYPSDFELLYRKPARAKKAPTAPKKEAK